VLVDHFPEQQVTERRLRLEPDRLMPASERMREGRLLRPVRLPVAEREVRESPADGRKHVPSPARAGGEDHEREHRQREQRVDDSYHAPGDAFAREGPEKLRSVARARIQQSMTAVAEQTEKVRLAERQAPAYGPVKRQSADERADRNER